MIYLKNTEYTGESMKKIFVFDLDNTLAELGREIPEHIVNMLCIIENAGHIIAVCSGKPIYYLCGMMRQVGLDAPVMIGENGAAIQFGVKLPPAQRYRVSYSPDVDEAIRRLRSSIEKEAGFDVWFQPNEVCLTPFYSTKEEEMALERIFQNHRELIEAELDCFKHCDSFDLMPKGVNKKSGLSCLSDISGIKSDNFVAVGDGKNDYPMFEYAGTSIGIKLEDADIVDYNFESINDALIYILDNLL